MKVSISAWLLLFFELAASSMAFVGEFCWDVDHAVFITNKETPDHSTFSLQRSFLQGLTERLTLPSAKLSFLIFDRTIKGENLFRAIFLNVSKEYFRPEMLYGKPKEIRKVQTAAEFLPLNSRHGFKLVLSIDVVMPDSFYFMKFSISDKEVDDLSSVCRKNYEIFTYGLQGIQFKRFPTLNYMGKYDLQDNKFTRVYSSQYKGKCGGWCIDQMNTIFCENTQMFQNYFEMIYQNICAKNRLVINWALEYPSKYSTGYLNVVDFSDSVKVTIYFFRSTWVLIRMDKPSDLKSTCSKEGMSIHHIGNKYEARIFGNFLQRKFANFHYFAKQELILHFGLVRPQNTVGRRFAWATGKGLSYSLWADGEPKGGAKFDCVQWKLGGPERNNFSWVSSECHNEQSNVFLFCSNETQYKHDTVLSITPEKTRYPFRDVQTQKWGEIYVEGYLEETIKTSISFAMASKFIKRMMFYYYQNLTIKGYVHDEPVTISHGQNESFLTELGKLFHGCDGADSSQGVPYSQVCDGIQDCPSGSDEAECEMTGYPSCSDREFSCTSGQCVPLKSKCDLIRDCHDGSDEDKCDQICLHRLCGNGRCLPRSWFHDGQVDCSDSSDELKSEKEPCVLICNRTQCVTRDMLNDGIVDCRGPEGPIDETLGALESFNCPQKGKHSFINNWAPRCVLYHDIFQEIIGCRDFSHLEDCEDYVCPPGYAKCPDSFCIPIAYINDDKEDCDYGEDEDHLTIGVLVNLFKCHPERYQYITLSSVCDGRKDCSNGEDEFDCEWNCSPGFICLAGAISATRHRKDQPLSDWSFISPKIRHVDISGIQAPDFFRVYPKTHFNYLLFLNLSGCGIEDTRLGKKKTNSFKTKSGSEDFQAVRTLDLSHNNIVTVGDRSVFSILYHLETLDLSHNDKLIDVGIFFHMKYLKHLDLSFTSINHLQRNTFLPLRGLKTLSLKQTRVTAIDFILPASVSYFNVEQTSVLSVTGDLFTRTGASPGEIHSSSFKVCCPQVLGPSIQRHLCHSPATEVIFSCDDLVEEWLLRVLLWLVGLATLAGNIVTLVYRLTWERQLLSKPYGLFVTNLGVSDTLMGCYLVILATADLMFQGEYVLHDHSWRTGGACRSAGTIATLSSITSTSFVFLITLDRFLAVRYPYGEIRFTKQTMTAAVSATWMLGMVLAVLPLLPFAENWVIYSSNGMCLGLPLRRERLPGWQYTVFLFVGLNFVFFLLIGVGQVAIFMNVRQKKRHTTKNLNPESQLFQNQRREEIAIAKKLALVVISNFICWFPIITLGLMTLCGVDVGAAAYRWSAVVLLPVNSALNPLLYTLPAIKKKFKDYHEARQLAKAAANKIRKRQESPDSCLKTSWYRKITILRRWRRSLINKEVYRICAFSEFETVYKKVIDLRAACKQ